VEIDWPPRCGISAGLWMQAGRSGFYGGVREGAVNGGGESVTNEASPKPSVR